MLKGRLRPSTVAHHNLVDGGFAYTTNPSNMVFSPEMN